MLSISFFVVVYFAINLLTSHSCFFLLSSSYKLVSRAKSLNWSVEWGLDEDSNLLKGIYEYGVGNWEALKMDPELNLHEKVKTRTKKKSALIITTFESLTSNVA